MATNLTAAVPVAVERLTKRFGDQRAVDDLTFSIPPGRVTGFLGPNGAGKTTTLRMLVGLTTPTSGTASVFGVPYGDLPAPALAVGTLIDASGFHPGRQARHELLVRAAAIGVPDDRVPTVLAEVGVEAAATKRVGELSLGMRQRLGLAVALLGDPRLLILDEPANGLDPAGMHWLRTLLRRYAERGTAVFVSSHALAELAQFADDVIVLNHGQLVTHSSVLDLVARGAGEVLVRTPDEPALWELLAINDARIAESDDGLVVTGLDAAAIGDLAAAAGIRLHQLHTRIQTLEDVFLDLTDDQEACS